MWSTVWAEDSGREGAASAQQLPAYCGPEGAHFLRKQRHCVAILVQHCVAVGLLKAQDDCAPAHVIVVVKSSRSDLILRICYVPCCDGILPRATTSH